MAVTQQGRDESDGADADHPARRDDEAGGLFGPPRVPPADEAGARAGSGADAAPHAGGDDAEPPPAAPRAQDAPGGADDAPAPGDPPPASGDDATVDREALLAGLIEPPAPDAPDLSGATLDALVAELGRRERQVAKLLREKERLRARLAEIDREVAALSPAPADSGPAPVAVTYRKPIADLTVAEALARVFEIGEEFSPSLAAERLLDAGFQSRASNFRQIVSQTLTRERRFKRLSRGVYQRTA